MTKDQKEIFDNRLNEWSSMLDQIGFLNISDKWITIFTTLCLDRGFRSLNEIQITQMENIAGVDSEAVTYLSLQDKRAGLNMLEDLSVKVEDEKTRLKAIQLILEKGIKPSKNELDLIIHTATSIKNLFDVK